MLTELKVRQFALIDELSLQFEAGMTVFSGETGAGKSILVDALGAAFGTRASSDWVRHGADKAEVTAVVESGDNRLASLLAEQDIDPDDQLILRRIINADGRSKAYVNGTPVPAKVLQQIGELCLDLHGQHEHQALLHTDFQRQIVDARIAESLLSSVADAHQELERANKALNALNQDRSATEQQEAWMRGELARLRQLAIEEGCVEQLTEQVEAGRHSTQIQQGAADALTLLDDDEASVRSLLARATHAVEHASTYNESLREALELLQQMDALASEAEPLLRHALDSSLDVNELQQAEERLMDIHDAMKRHNADEAGLMALMGEWEEKLALLDTASWDEASLKARRDAAEKGYREAAGALNRRRQEVAAQLVGELRPFLDRLGLEGMQIRIEIEPRDDENDWHPYGWDTIEFVASSNPGEPFRPLATIASGGELSRFVLALKGCGALVNAPQIAVFDEVDVGIGGETAWCVGELLASMGRERQLLVVSHLPQVAACADHQVLIRKGVEGERTLTRLEKVAAEKRQHEIARMLGGASDESLQHAARMLERGTALDTNRIKGATA